MADIILDTNVLADLLAQYYELPFLEKGVFRSYKTLNSKLVKEINKTISLHTGLIIASTFAFVEIARQFQKVSQDRFTVDQFAAFIDQPPDWFFISSVDVAILPHLAHLPSEIRLPNGKVEAMELADAIHLATAMSRDNCLIAATDGRMLQVTFLKSSFI